MASISSRLQWVNTSASCQAMQSLDFAIGSMWQNILKVALYPMCNIYIYIYITDHHTHFSQPSFACIYQISPDIDQVFLFING